MLGVSLSARELERQSPTPTPKLVPTARSIVAPKIGKGRDTRNNDHTPHQPFLNLIWGLLDSSSLGCGSAHGAEEPLMRRQGVDGWMDKRKGGKGEKNRGKKGTSHTRYISLLVL